MGPGGTEAVISHWARVPPAGLIALDTWGKGMPAAVSPLLSLPFKGTYPVSDAQLRPIFMHLPCTHSLNNYLVSPVCQAVRGSWGRALGIRAQSTSFSVGHRVMLGM